MPLLLLSLWSLAGRWAIFGTVWSAGGSSTFWTFTLARITGLPSILPIAQSSSARCCSVRFSLLRRKKRPSALKHAPLSDRRGSLLLRPHDQAAGHPQHPAGGYRLRHPWLFPPHAPGESRRGFQPLCRVAFTVQDRAADCHLRSCSGRGCSSALDAPQGLQRDRKSTRLNSSHIPLSRM